MIKAASIKHLRVHPGLGIARLGNAAGKNDFLFASEVPGGMPSGPLEGFRDDKGHIRRQAVRFRVYAEFEDGTCREISADDGVRIEWTVEVANLKAGWYNFENAMDLPDPFAKEAARRNASVQGADRAQLNICPGPRSVEGVMKSDPALHFDTGSFFGKKVDLGELRTDEKGRLIFLGGRGLSAPQVAGAKPQTFANNDGWHDDTADGPVWAKVTFEDGGHRDAEPGYVVVAPPNFAPGLFGVVTMLDVVKDMFHRAEPEPLGRCSFARDIWPIFQRLTDLQWTNHGIYMLTGVGSPLDAHAPEVLKKLRDSSPANAGFRATVFRLFRMPGAGAAMPSTLLPFYGDYYGDYEDQAGEGLAITSLMRERLQAWSAGAFDDDWTGEPVPAVFADLDARAQIDALDSAGLFECLGGPFHPGIELTWVTRMPSVWKSAFRLDVRSGVAPQDFGDALTPATCVGRGGPYDGVRAGALTRFLGTPWQTDEASCLSDLEYEPSTYLSFPSYWGARVPNRVLSAQAWERVNAGSNSSAQAMKHFSWREDWLRDLSGDYAKKIAMMVSKWWELGILEHRSPGAAGVNLGIGPAWIESGRPASVTGSNSKVSLAASIESLSGGVNVQIAGGMNVQNIGGMALHAAYIPPRRRLRRDEI